MNFIEVLMPADSSFFSFFHSFLSLSSHNSPSNLDGKRIEPTFTNMSETEQEHQVPMGEAVSSKECPCNGDEGVRVTIMLRHCEKMAPIDSEVILFCACTM